MQRSQHRSQRNVVRVPWLPGPIRLLPALLLFPLCICINILLADSALKTFGLIDHLHDGSVAMGIGCFLIIVLAYAPARALYSRLGWKWRTPDGHCLTCGYSLTGNVSGVCPECGERI